MTRKMDIHHRHNEVKKYAWNVHIKYFILCKVNILTDTINVVEKGLLRSKSFLRSTDYLWAVPRPQYPLSIMTKTMADQEDFCDEWKE